MPVALRPGMGTGKYDAFLLMPRGARDEEFHTAVTELLSDWGSTAPVVPTAHIVSAGLDPLTVALRDFAYQMGMPAEVVTPDSEKGREVLARHGDASAFPVVSALGDITTQPSSVRDLAATIYGSVISNQTADGASQAGALASGLAAAAWAMAIFSFLGVLMAFVMGRRYRAATGTLNDAAASAAAVSHTLPTSATATRADAQQGSEERL